MAVLGSRRCAGFSSCSEGGYSNSGAQASQCSGFSFSSSRAQAQELWWMALVALQHMGSSQTRDQTTSPALAGGFFITEPPANTLKSISSWRPGREAQYVFCLPPEPGLGHVFWAATREHHGWGDCHPYSQGHSLKPTSHVLRGPQETRVCPFKGDFNLRPSASAGTTAVLRRDPHSRTPSWSPAWWRALRPSAVSSFLNLSCPFQRPHGDVSSTPLLSPKLLVGSKTSLQPPAVLTHHPGGFISVYSKPTSCEQASKSPHPLLPGLARASLLSRAFLVALPGSFCPKLEASNRARNHSQHQVPSSPSFPSTELKRTWRNSCY